MEYTQGALGRIYVLKFKDQDDLLSEMSHFAQKQKIHAGVFVCLGALRKGQIVTGPRKPVIPPEPYWRKFNHGWEVMGLGTLFTNPQGPQIHLHLAMGKKRETITGCLRNASSIFLVMEAVFFELKNVKAHKNIDAETGMNLLQLMMPLDAAFPPPLSKKTPLKK